MRNTYDDYEVQGNYGQGWECVTAEPTRKAALEQLRTYQANDTAHAYRVKKVRVKITCDSCQLASIQGTLCHETGCKNSSARFDTTSGGWIQQYECRECGLYGGCR